MYDHNTPMKPPVSVQPLLETSIRQIAAITAERRNCLPIVCIVHFPEGMEEMAMNRIHRKTLDLPLYFQRLCLLSKRREWDL
jgi:hypothetical protein